ncbi:MAG: hypothetical protein RL092_1572, partial [Bacteroidota bacterium]
MTKLVIIILALSCLSHENHDFKSKIILENKSWNFCQDAYSKSELNIGKVILKGKVFSNEFDLEF